MDQEQSTENRADESQDQPQDMDQQPGGGDTGQSDAGGADSAAEKGQKQDDSDEGRTDAEAETDEAKEKVKALEDDPPQNLEDWPSDAAKYKTFGGAEGETSWDEGPTAKLGESNVRHHDDGSVSVEGEKVDNPDDYKGEPIPGGPTDPDTKSIGGEKDLTDKDSGDDEGSGDDDGSDDQDSGD